MERVKVKTIKEMLHVEVKHGVRQSGVLSPLLFILHMDRIIKDAVEETEVSPLVQHKQMILLQLQTVKKTSKLKWKCRKMCWINIRCRIVDECCKDRGNANQRWTSSRKNCNRKKQQLVQVDHFKYLGVKFWKKTTGVRGNGKITNYINILRIFYPLLKEKDIFLQCKTSICLPITTNINIYGGDSWVLNTFLGSKHFNFSRIQAAEMKVLRMIIQA